MEQDIKERYKKEYLKGLESMVNDNIIKTRCEVCIYTYGFLKAMIQFDAIKETANINHKDISDYYELGDDIFKLHNKEER